MTDLLLADDDGRIIVQPDGTGIAVLSVGARGPAVPAWSADDFKVALLALLPTGAVWPRDDGAVLPELAAALAPTFARLTDRGAAMLGDSPVGLLIERLEEWEATTGLPDPCGNGYQDLLARNRSVLARIPGAGGQSVPYIVALAAALGYAVEVQEFRPSYCDDALGLPLGGEEWGSRWRVVVAPQASDAWDAVNHRWFVTVLECAIRRMAPAHTELAFIYRAAGLGPFILGRDVLAPAS